MSYSIGIYVKVEGCDKFAEIAYPEYSSPSYNLGRLFRSCMDLNYYLFHKKSCHDECCDCPLDSVESMIEWLGKEDDHE